MGQKSRWTLPQTVHPEGYRRFVVCVPDERFYIAAFEGLLIELTYSKNWQRDNAHTAAIVSRLWQDILANVTCEPECPTAISESDYEMSVCEQLRYHNGKLQGYCCGEWVDITGQGTLPPGGGTQPGSGSDQPPVGGCATYHASMNASNKWYLPTVVSTDDIITISNAKGAGNDGTVSPWECPEGTTFFANLCIPGTGGTSGGDPLNTVKHMRLIAKVGATYVDILAGPYTVPGGVTNAEVFFQVNDSTISDNAGSYTFDVQVCNNQTPVWTSVLDFRLNSYASIRSGGYGIWAAGIGLQGENAPLSGASVIQPDLDMAAFTLTGYEMLYNCASVGGSNQTAGVYQIGASSGYVKAVVAPAVGTNLIDAATVTKLAVTELQPTLNSGTTGGAVVLKQLTVYGSGPKPPQLP